MKLLRARDYARLPWKNGLGVSRVIAAQPAGAGYDTLDWQVSTTQITADCPFSSLPGLDRIFLVLKGEGVELTCQRPEGELLAQVRPLGGPFAFRGDWQTECRLLGGPVEVFNVLTRRAKVLASVVTGPGALECGAGQTLLAYLATGDCAVVDGAAASDDTLASEVRVWISCNLK